MNTKSYKATLRQSSDECVGIGDFIFNADKSWLYIVLPNAEGKFMVDTQGRAVLDPIHVSRMPIQNPRVWTWDGNEENPTLSPSIDWPGHWHGYLTNGQLKSC